MKNLQAKKMIVAHTPMTMSQLPICINPNSGPAHFDI
jgi:hypothetical protein